MPPNKSKRPFREEGDEMERKNKRPRQEQEEEDMDIGGLRSPASSHNKPAELFRKDLISAMKMADTEQLDAEDYFLIADPWRQDWEKGVQVPVNEDTVNEANIKEVKSKERAGGDFKIPRKYLHGSKDETYQQGIHELTGMQQLADQVIRYDLDDLDVCWLNLANEKREETSEILIDEWVMEQVIEALESQCHEVMQIKMKTEEGLGIEYDEDIVCAVCASPESEECNEMVFCDGCDICVHQACYGIQKIPEGSWLCRTCALGIKPTCILCPKSGGAMKSTRSGTKWAHVNCALWIPEVSIGCVEKMEPITKISQIPASRWSLICCLCKERCGACIQCSVKACKTAFHVSCAFQNNLEMKTILTDELADDGGVKLKAYCPRHSKKGERRGSESDAESPRKSLNGSPRKELSDEEIAKMRAEKMQQLNEDFYTFVDVPEIASRLNLDESAVEMISVFWKLKRKAQFDMPLLTPKKEEEDLLEKQQEDSLLARMKMFVQLRQDLERVRNLCYMVSKREKMKKQFYKDREAVFMAMHSILTNTRLHIGQRDVNKIVEMYHFDSIYDSKVFDTLKIPLATVEDEEDQMEEEEEEDNPSMETSPLIPPVKNLENLNDQEEVKTEPKCITSINKSKKPSSKQRRSLRKRSKRVSEGFTELSDDGDTEMTDVDSLYNEPRLTVEARSLRSQKSPGSSLCGDEEETTYRGRRASPEKTKPKEYVEELKPQVEVRQRTKRESFTKAERELRRVSKMDSSEELGVPDMVNSSKANVVSEKVKEEVNSYLQNSKLVIPDKIKSRIHRGLIRNRTQIANIASGYVQTSLETFLSAKLGKKSPVSNSPNRSPTPKSPVSRVLNEISPGRTRHGSSNSICRSQSSSPKRTKSISESITNSLEKNLMDSFPRETRSVRRRIDNVFDVFHVDFDGKCSGENSPSSSVRSARQLRSMSPASVNSELIDVENLYESDNTLRRITRSQGLDSTENSRDSFTSSRSGIS